MATLPVAAGLAVGIGFVILFSSFSNGLVSEDGNMDAESPQYRIVFAAIVDQDNYDLYVINADGSNLTNLTNDKLWDVWPRVSPDGSKIAYHSFEGQPAGYGTLAYISVINNDGTGKKQILESTNGVGHIVWSPDSSRIAFNESNQIVVVNADGTGYKSLTSDERPVSNFNPVWMSNDTIAFEKVRYDEKERRFPEASFYEVDISSGETRKLFDFDYNNSGSHVWSSDRSKIAFKQSGDTFSTFLYVMDSQGNNPTKATTTDSGAPGIPLWSPDSSKILFSNSREFVQISIDDSGNVATTSLAKSGSFDEVEAWSDDGRKIAFTRGMDEEGYAIYVMDSDGGNQKKVVELRFPDYAGSIDWLSH